ncbi:MAG TPA: ABC transporter ATP-binding protein [Bacteroidetes bacterium]|nr:ABC transporter ATP-binding protein [Bacteroidota bacterium]
MTQPIIEMKDIVKFYGEVKAVDHLSLNIFHKEVFGLLGPNGAGKTTVVEILEGLRKADAGEISVLDQPVPEKLDRIKQKLGVQLQITDLPELIRVKELLVLFAGYYNHSLPVAQVLEMAGLTEKKQVYTKHLSGGQKQRLALALALINDPEILILDEPTTGLDPQARRNIWEIIKNWQKAGKTILLTTHYMEEAEQICDRVGIIDRGKIIALGTPEELIRKQNLATAIEFELSENAENFDEKLFPEIEEFYRQGQNITAFSREPQKILVELVRALDNGSLPIKQISLRKTSLEDVFLELTGRKIRD